MVKFVAVFVGKLGEILPREDHSVDHNASTQQGTGFPQAELLCVNDVNEFGNVCSLSVKLLFLIGFVGLCGSGFMWFRVVMGSISVVHREAGVLDIDL